MFWGIDGDIEPFIYEEETDAGTPLIEPLVYFPKHSFMKDCMSMHKFSH